MPTEEMIRAGEFIRELQAQLSQSQELAKHEIPFQFEQLVNQQQNNPQIPADHPNNNQRTPPAAFQESSYLFIRSYDADMGLRPLASTLEFWNSPDITVTPVTATGAYTKTLEAGQTYRVECIVRNRGDLMVPSANVEFYLTNPTLGFNTKFAKRIGVTSGWIDSMGSTKVSMEYIVPGTESGHKCLFARAFSFSPLDLPLDDYQLLPLVDRHIAQLNLMIVPQASVFRFELVHLPNTMESISLVALNQEQLLSLRHPFLAEFDTSQNAAHQFMGHLQPEIVNRRQEGMNGAINFERDFMTHGSFSNFSFSAQIPEGMDVQTQAAITQDVLASFQVINAEQARPSAFRDLYRLYREMNQPMQLTQFAMQLPDFGLQAGQAVGIQIRNLNNLTQQIKGGITLIITG